MPESEDEIKETSGSSSAEKTDEAPGAEPGSYYYDDAHGYEDFDPEHDEEEAADSAS